MIEARGLTRRYRSTLAVDDLTFQVRPGVVTGFLGPNGAGKSTTLRMLLGLERPTAGSVTVGGRAYRDLRDPLRTVGALLDAKWVHPRRTARDAAALPARLTGRSLRLPGGHCVCTTNALDPYAAPAVVMSDQTREYCSQPRCPVGR